MPKLLEMFQQNFILCPLTRSGASRARGRTPSGVCLLLCRNRRIRYSFVLKLENKI